MDRQKKIEKRWVLINRLFIFLIVFTVLMIFYREYKSFSDSVDFFNKTSYDAMIHGIEHEVDNRIQEIASVKEEIDENYREEIKKLVQDADFFASEVIASLDDNATLEQKREAYIDVVYNYDLRDEDYLFFAMDLDGLSYLSGTTKTLEGTDISGLIDEVTGRFFVLDMIDEINASPDKDGYVTYYWMKISGGEHFKKTSYVYYNEDVDLFIGTGIYEVDYIDTVQDELFSRISSYYVDETDYIYIFGFDGTVYFYPTSDFDTEDLLNIQTSTGIGFHEYLVSALETNESAEVEYYFDFFEDDQLKYGYVRRIDDWQMYIGRSFIVDDLVIEQNTYFQSIVIDYVVFNIILILIILALVIAIKRLINVNFSDIQSIFQAQSNKVKELSYKDQLTKLYNRNYFDEFNQSEFLDCEMITAIMIDANGLKLINDAYGHISGDKLLIELSSILIDVFDSGDHFRWGGDEFVVILKNITKDELKDKIELFHKKCSEVKIKDFIISASLGYVQRSPKDIDLYNLIDEAEAMMYDNKMYESLSTKRRIIDNILDSLYNNFSFEEAHSENVKEYSLLLGNKLKLSSEDMNKLRLAALMHDVGKIGVPDNILNKKEKLSNLEIEEIRKHPEKGMRILSAYPELSEFGNYALTHHERWDGTGYPRGLKGEEIPLYSRIIAIADAFDAMTSDRIYKNRINKKQAIEELLKNKGTQFDPKLVDLFVAVISK